MKKFPRTAYIRSALRRIWRWSPEPSLCRKAARQSRNVYLCNKCLGFFPNSEITVDHIIPVTPPNFTDDWTEYVKRLFCGIEGLQVLCRECHDKKTKAERALNKKKKL